MAHKWSSLVERESAKKLGFADYIPRDGKPEEQTALRAKTNTVSSMPDITYPDASSLVQSRIQPIWRGVHTKKGDSS
jgi:hypothetical protein